MTQYATIQATCQLFAIRGTIDMLRMNDIHMISIASDAAMYGLGTAPPILLSGLRELGRTTLRYSRLPPTALLAEH